jgi:hypothetical protein
MTVAQVYRLIPDQFMQKLQEQEDALGKYIVVSGGNVTGDHEWLEETGEGQADMADELWKEMMKNAPPPTEIKDNKDKEDGKTQGYISAGPGSQAEAMARFAEMNNVSLRWTELLNEVNPDYFRLYGKRPRPSYHKPRRKLAAIQAANRNFGVLPVPREENKRQGEMPAIAMFMDGSGSCGAYHRIFVALMQSVPKDEITLFPYSFSTYVTPLNINEKNPAIAQGGTEFSIIEDMINKEIRPKLDGRYPKAVVVLSDGEGYFSSTKVDAPNGGSWLWLITENGRRGLGVRPGKDIDIDKFTEGMKFPNS